MVNLLPLKKLNPSPQNEEVSKNEARHVVVVAHGSILLLNICSETNWGREDPGAMQSGGY